MFLVLLSKEVRQQLLTFRFAAALVTTFVLVVVSVWVLGEDYTRRRDAFNVAVERSARQNREVYVPTQINPTLHRPPTPLGIFAQGEDRRFGNSVSVHRWEVPREARESFADNMLLAAQPPFDLYIIFAVVVSLFGILLTYDGISGEREQGTLRFVCTGRSGRGAIFAAKFAAGILSLAAPFLFSFAAGLVVLAFVFGITFTPAQWLAVALMALAGLAFGALFIAAGLACSALLRRSSTALVVALLFWALGVLIIPSAAQSIAGAVVELPPATELSHLERTIEDDLADEIAEFYRGHRGAGSGWTGWSGSSYWKFDGTERQFSDSEEYVRFVEPRRLARANLAWDMFQHQERRRLRQAELAEAISAAAPVHHLRLAFTALAGTDLSTHEEFMEMIRRYRRAMIEGFQERGYFGDNALRFFSRRARDTIGPGRFERRLVEYRALSARLSTEEFWQTVGIEAWGPLPPDEIPPFYPPNPEPDFSAAAWPMAVLAVAAAAAFCVGLAAFYRYDVR